MKQIVGSGSSKFHHVHNRGRLDRDIFIDHRDYFRFTLLLYCCNNDRPVSTKSARCVGANYYGLCDIKRGKPLVDIVSHSLMPNRFHLLLRERKPGNLSKFMSKLSTGYSMYFNKKYKREGALFAGPFRSTKVETDAYMKYLFAYIHLKPLKHKAVRKKGEPKYLGDEKVRDSLRRYEYSSYLDYVENNRRRKAILDTDTFYKFFQTPKDFEQNIFDWLRFEKTEDLPDHPDFFKVGQKGGKS
jgi:putative transposase